MKKILLILILIFTLLVSCKKEDNDKLLFIELENVSNIEIYQNTSYNYENVKVIAYYKNYKEDVTKKSSFSSVDTTIIGKQTITVNYLDCSAEYDINIIYKNDNNYSILVNKTPKTNYYIGEKLDTTGIEVVVYINNIYYSILDYQLLSFKIQFGNKIVDSFSNEGIHFILVSAKVADVEVQTSYMVNVIRNPLDEITETLYLDISNVKTKYKLNEEFDPTGLKVYIVDKFDNRYEIPYFDCEITLYFNNIKKESFDVEGTYIIYVTLGQISAFYSITVEYVEPVKKIVLNYDFVKTEFYLGDTFSPYGLEILYYEDDILKEYVNTSNADITLYRNGSQVISLDYVGVYCVQIRYNGCYAEYYIKVVRR